MDYCMRDFFVPHKRMRIEEVHVQDAEAEKYLREVFEELPNAAPRMFFSAWESDAVDIAGCHRDYLTRLFLPEWMEMIAQNVHCASNAFSLACSTCDPSYTLPFLSYTPACTL